MKLNLLFVVGTIGERGDACMSVDVGNLSTQFRNYGFCIISYFRCFDFLLFVFIGFLHLPNFKWVQALAWWSLGCWYVDHAKSMIWHYIDKGELGYKVRPPCCFGTPIIEEYPYRDDITIRLTPQVPTTILICIVSDWYLSLLMLGLDYR